MKSRLNARKVSVAVVISTVFHALLLTAFMVSTSSKFSNISVAGEGVEEAETTGQSVEVDLMGKDESVRAIAQAYQPPASEATRFSSFMEMAATDQPTSDYTPLKSNPAQSITEALGENPFEPQADPATAAKAATEARVKADQAPNATMRDLWQAIAPCWNRITDKSTLPVTLQVSFSPMGNLAKPPVIIRESGGRISDLSLRSEGQAISALSQCGPYLMVFGQENLQINFPRKK